VPASSAAVHNALQMCRSATERSLAAAVATAAATRTGVAPAAVAAALAMPAAAPAAVVKTGAKVFVPRLTAGQKINRRGLCAAREPAAGSSLLLDPT